MHKLSDLDVVGLTAMCAACLKNVDIYPNGKDRKGNQTYRCGPAIREYQRAKYERLHPDARKYNRHPLTETVTVMPGRFRKDKGDQV